MNIASLFSAFLTKVVVYIFRQVSGILSFPEKVLIKYLKVALDIASDRFRHVESIVLDI